LGVALFSGNTQSRRSLKPDAARRERNGITDRQLGPQVTLGRSREPSETSSCQ
jgi:hypothetical protein